MRTLPNPAGSYLVGSTAGEITDLSRACHVASGNRGRRILVKLWYPAEASASSTCRQELLWEQLRSEANIPGFARLLLRPAMKILTNSHRGAPYATEVGPPRILIYSHGLISFASENSMLMEHLASRGYVVLSLQHLDQLAEFRALQQAQPEEEKQEQARLERRVKASAREERAALSKEYFSIASNTNKIVSARSLDIDYAVAELETLLGLIPGVDRSAAAELVGAAGLSLGGAVATEYAKRSGSAGGCVVNIDGGIYGERRDQPIGQRYLMLYCEENRGSNDLSLRATDGIAITERVIPHTKHLNFHDIAAIYPALKWLRVIGSANPMAVVGERNRLISDFIGPARASPQL